MVPRGRLKLAEDERPKTWRERIVALRYVPKLFGLVWQTHRGYTLAIVLAELGQPAGSAPAIVATDVDPGAVAEARAGAYGEAALVEVPPAIRARCLA